MSENSSMPEEIRRWAKEAVLDESACFALPTRWEGGDITVPAIVVKGPPGCALVRPEVIVTVVGMETPESHLHVIAVGLGLPHQTRPLRRQYWCFLPIDTVAQVRLLRLMAGIPAWAILVAAGDALTEPQFTNVGDATTAGLQHIVEEVGRRPPAPGADVQAAVARVREVILQTWPAARSTDGHH
jgi:hypothetical protein